MQLHLRKSHLHACCLAEFCSLAEVETTNSFIKSMCQAANFWLSPSEFACASASPNSPEPTINIALPSDGPGNGNPSFCAICQGWDEVMGVYVERGPEPGRTAECCAFDPNLDPPRTTSYTWSHKPMTRNTQESLINFISMPTTILASTVSTAATTASSGMTIQPLPTSTSTANPTPTNKPSTGKQVSHMPMDSFLTTKYIHTSSLSDITPKTSAFNSPPSCSSLATFSAN